MSASELWPWLVLAGLGLFHGVNPAMGWLFAVALGLQRGSGAAVLQALPPIALGHAAAIALAVVVVASARWAIDVTLLRIAAAVCLIGFGAWHLARGYRHQSRVGMQVGFRDLTLWSFLMATAHGAGLKVMPVLLEMPGAPAHPHGAHDAALSAFAGSLWTGLLAVLVHTAAMLLAAGLVAWAIFAWIGLAILRRAWINLDLVWSLVLIATGAIFLVLAGADLLSRDPAHHHHHAELSIIPS
jgi:hypothetical protein